jgi:hypothetical protein
VATPAGELRVDLAGRDDRREIFTAKLRDTAVAENWLQILEAGAAARHVGQGLDKLAKSIDMAAKYEALPIEEKRIVCAEVDRLLKDQAKSEIHLRIMNEAPAPIPPDA